MPPFPPYKSSWQEVLDTLPPGQQAELGALLAGHGEDETADDDDTT